MLIDLKPTRTPSLGVLGFLNMYDEQDLRKIGSCFINKRWVPESMPAHWKDNSHFQVPAPVLSRFFDNDTSPEFMKQWLQPSFKKPDIELTQPAVDFYRQWQKYESQLAAIKRGDEQIINTILLNHGVDDKFFHRKPKPHQKAGMAFFFISMDIGSGHICLFDEMRTGKTKQAIDIGTYLIREKKIGCILVLVPNSIKRVWLNEIRKDSPFYGIMSCIIQGTKVQKSQTWNSLMYFYITNYECARADVGALYEWQKWAKERGGYLLVCDEAHKLKNPDAQQTQAVMNLDPDYSIFITGTPVANRPEDVYCMSNFICPGVLGSSYADFQSRFGVRGGWQGRQITEYKDLDEIKYRLARLSLRRLRKDVVFDKIVRMERFGTMSGKQLKAYQDMRDLLWAEVMAMNGDSIAIRARSMLTRTLRLQQITSGFFPKQQVITEYSDDPDEDVIWFDEDWKVKELDEFIGEYLDEIGKLVIWSRFVPVIERLVKRYERYGAVKIRGQMKKDSGIDNMYRFQQDPSCRIMVANLMCGLGLGFQPATFCWFYDKWYSPYLNKQSEDRIKGIENPVPVTVVSAITEGSIDERIEFLLERKKLWADDITGDISADLKLPQLDKQTLLYLLANPEEADRYIDKE